jgi:protein TonB
MTARVNLRVMKTLLYLTLLFAMASQTAVSQVHLAPPSRVNVAPSVAEEYLIHKTDPVIKPMRMAARVTGTVVMAVVIRKTGHVLRAKVISGPKMLQQAALDAVRKYEYKPYLLDNTPVEMATRVSIRFSLN